MKRLVTNIKNIFYKIYKKFDKEKILTLVEILNSKRFYIYLFLYLYLIIYFSFTIFGKIFNWEIVNNNINNKLNFISAIATICGSIAALYQYIILAISDSVLKRILENKIHEILIRSSVKNISKIDYYLFNELHKSSAKKLLNMFRENLIEQGDDFVLNFEQLIKVLYSIKKQSKLNEREFFAFMIQFFSDNYWHWDEFIQFSRTLFLKNENEYREGIWLFLLSKDENIKLEEKSERVSEYLHEIFKTKKNILENIIEAETTLNDQDLFSHIVSNTYIQADYNADDNIKLHKGPVLLIKNEEKFSSWWKKIDELLSKKLLKDKRITEEEFQNFEAREFLKKEKEGIVTQPFYTAIKRSNIIHNFLEFFTQSPVFYFDTRDIPPEYSGNPKLYINKKLKPIARAKHSELINFIKKTYKIKSLPKKEIILNFQLIPFKPDQMVIKVDSEDYPKPIQKLMISSMLSYDQKKRLIRSHIIETKKFINELTPFSLLAKSLPLDKIEELKKAESQLLREIGLIKNGKINFKGLDSIVSQEKNMDNIITIFSKKLNTMHIKIKKSELKQALKEIFNNAKRIKEKIS